MSERCLRKKIRIYDVKKDGRRPRSNDSQGNVSIIQASITYDKR